MPIACSRGSVKTYVLKCDRHLPVEQQTRFHILSVTRRAMSKIEDALASLEGDQMVPRAGSGNFAAVAYGVRWENLNDATGKPVKPRVVSINGVESLDDASMDAIGPYIAELAGEVFAHNGLTERDLGNFDSSPSSPASSSSQTKQASSPCGQPVRSAMDNVAHVGPPPAQTVAAADT